MGNQDKIEHVLNIIDDLESIRVFQVKVSNDGLLTNYKTTSMLCIPIFGPTGDIIGVANMINNKEPNLAAFKEKEKSYFVHLEDLRHWKFDAHMFHSVLYF